MALKEMNRTTLSEAEIKEANVHFKEWLRGDEGGVTKFAAAATDLIRVRVREGSINRNILVNKPITPDDLTPSTTHDNPRYIGEIEPDTPGGIVVPVGARPRGWYFFGKKYEAVFARVETPRFNKDTSQLLTYKNDLRQIISDMSLKDLLSLEDERFFRAINNMLAPAKSKLGLPLLANETVPFTGNRQWRTIAAGVTPTSVNDALGVMNDSVGFGLDPATVVVNLKFAKEMQKWGRDDFGGDIAEEVKRNGFTERNFLGVRWLITVKNWLVRNGTMYMFAPQEFIGNSLVLTDTTMHVKKDAYNISFWAYEEVAQIIGHIAGVCRVDLTGVA